MIFTPPTNITKHALGTMSIYATYNGCLQECLVTITNKNPVISFDSALLHFFQLHIQTNQWSSTELLIPKSIIIPILDYNADQGGHPYPHCHGHTQLEKCSPNTRTQFKMFKSYDPIKI